MIVHRLDIGLTAKMVAMPLQSKYPLNSFLLGAEKADFEILYAALAIQALPMFFK